MGGFPAALVDVLRSSKNPPLDFVVVDGHGTLAIHAASLWPRWVDSGLMHLFFAGDLGQRIFNNRFHGKRCR